MHKLFHGRTASNNVNKPLPEPLVDPDEGKTPIGELVIVPIQGRDLPNRERFGKQDPFILFKLGNVSKRSSTDVRGGQRPRWKDDQVNIFMYESDAKDATSLYVTCLDEDSQKNELIGDCVINLAKVLEQGEQDDWFELHYKGREAGELMLQLTYYSHDPTHPTNKMNRAPNTPVPSNGMPGRRPIHPSSGPADHHSPAAVPVNTTSSAAPDHGPVYRPPVVTEPATPAGPAIGPGGYPYVNAGGGGGGVAGGRVSPLGGRVSPSGQHYAGHHVPNPGHPYGPSPYATVNGFPGYPNPGPHPQQQQGYPPQHLQGGYPMVGYPGGAFGGGAGGYPPVQGAGYPPQFNTASGYPPQLGNHNNFNTGYPPVHQPFNNNVYPPLNNNIGGFYPPVQQPLNNRPVSPSGGGYPPAGYQFAAANLYPSTSVGGGYPPQHQQQPQLQQQQQPQQQQPQQQQSQPMPVATSSGSAPSSYSSSTLPGAFPGMFPGSNPYSTSASSPPNNNNNFNALAGHKQSVHNGQPTSTVGNQQQRQQQGMYPRSSSPMYPGEYPRASSPNPPALPPRNNVQPQAPPSYAQTMYGAGRH